MSALNRPNIEMSVAGATIIIRAQVSDGVYDHQALSNLLYDCGRAVFNLVSTHCEPNPNALISVKQEMFYACAPVSELVR